ncbi:MAG: YceI family protein [Flavitalea sp.]
MESLMRAGLKKLILPASIFLAVFSFNSVFAQTSFKANVVKTTLEGTSNIHDWTMISQKGTCAAVVTMGGNNVTALSGLQFSMPAESLKSEHAQMDKNTYKHLKTSKYPTISFVSNSCTVKSTGGNNFQVVSRGKLTISGTTKDVDLIANGTVNADKSITFNGAYKFKMTDFNVPPVSIMLGAIKTGDGISVKYDLTLKAI